MRGWTTLQATAASVSFVGLGSDLNISATQVSVAINLADGAATHVVDYSLSDSTNSNSARKTVLEVPTGPSSNLTLTLDGAKGEMKRASGHLVLDVYHFFRVEGDLAIESSSAAVKLAKQANQSTGESVNVDLLSVGGSNLSAFVGINGGSSNQLGLSMTGANFALALMTEQLPSNSTGAARKWTTLQANAASVSFVGLGSDITVAATNVGVAVNQADGAATTVVDYGLSDPSNANSARNTALSIATGTNTTMALTLDGSMGEYIRATGHLIFNLYGFVRAEGDLAIESRDTTVKLGQTAEVVNVSALTIGGSHINVFVGFNSGTSDAMGLQLDDIDFGLAMLSSKSSPSRTWTALTVTAKTVGFVGFLDFLPKVRNLEVDINQVGKKG